MYQSVHYGVGQGRVLHGIVPVFHRQLAGNDSCFAVVPFFDDFEDLPLFGCRQGRDKQVIKDLHFTFDYWPDELVVTTVLSRNSDLLKQTGHSLVEGCVSVTTGFLAQAAATISSCVFVYAS